MPSRSEWLSVGLVAVVLAVSFAAGLITQARRFDARTAAIAATAADQGRQLDQLRAELAQTRSDLTAAVSDDQALRALLSSLRIPAPAPPPVIVRALVSPTPSRPAPGPAPTTTTATTTTTRPTTTTTTTTRPGRRCLILVCTSNANRR